MITIKSLEELFLIKESSQLVSKMLGMLALEIYPGRNTLYLDKLAEEFLRDNGGIPAFLGLYDFPNTLCVSINEQVVHGIPNHKPLYEGDIVSIDCGVLFNGYYGDVAYTFKVGDIDTSTKKLLEVTKRSLYIGISSCHIGKNIGDIGNNIQNYVEEKGYGVVRELVGHGLGKKIHEDPLIPNYGRKGLGEEIVEGMVLAIEPMITQGTHRVKFQKDGWTVTTLDKQLSAHFEHNIALINERTVLLSTYNYIYDSLGIKSKEEEPFIF